MNYFLNRIFVIIAFLTGLDAEVFAQAGVGPAPYCMPLYGQIPCNQPGPSNAGGNFINDFINSFNTTGCGSNITNNNSGCNSQFLAGVQRNYFSSPQTVSGSPGSVITCNMQSGNVYGQGFAIFIDWNQDNIFQVPGERVAGTAVVPPAGVFVALNFTIPGAQALGTYKMRVRCVYATTGNFIDPCNNTTYGETEDYNVQVVTASGYSATVTSNAPICSGQTLSLTLTPSSSVAATYTWTGPSGFTNNTQNPVIANAASIASGIYTVVINPAFNCPVTRTIAVNVNSTPTISSVSNTGPVCQGSPLTFSVNTTVAGTTTYSWSGPSFASNQANPTIGSAAVANTGNYTVTVTNTSTNGGVCISAGTTSAAVVAVAPVVITPATATICQNSNYSLTANAVGSTAYSWTGPAFTSTLQSPQLTNVSPLNSGNYSVTAFYTSSSTTLVCTSTAVSNLSVVPRNPVAVAITQNTCQNTLATLSANATGAAGYVWTGPNNYFSSAASNTITNIQPISSGIYSVNAIFVIGTVSCSTSNSGSLNVVPVSTITVNPPVSVCYPSSFSLTANAPGAITYLWTGPASFSSALSNPVLTQPQPSVSGVYSVTASFNNGNLTCYNSNSVQVTVNPILVFTLTAFNRVCYNSQLTVNGPPGATSYTWTSSNGFTSNTQDLSIPGVLPTQSGNYTLTINLGPCITAAATQVEVLSPMQLTLTPNSRSICQGDTIKLAMGSTGGSENYAYQWSPQVFLGSPTGSVASGTPQGTTIYNVTAYDIACPQFSLMHTFTVEVNLPPKPDLVLEKDNGCQPLCLFYDSKTKQDAAITTYDFGGDLKMQSDSFTYCLTEPGTYNLRILSKGKNGCYGVYNYPTPIVVHPIPQTQVSFDPEVPSTSNNVVTFSPYHKYGPVVNYEWSFQGASGAGSYDPDSVKNPVRVFDNVGKYPVMLVSTTDKGCSDTVFKLLDIRDEMSVYIPNTFTPNSDNLNDVFNVKGVGLKIEGFSMEIFDRWGTSVYFTKDITKGWDGNIKGVMSDDGVFIYKIKIIGANGEGKKEYLGHVTLLR